MNHADKLKQRCDSLEELLEELETMLSLNDADRRARYGGIGSKMVFGAARDVLTALRTTPVTEIVVIGEVHGNLTI